MKKINKLWKWVPTLAVVGTIAPIISLTSCNKGGDSSGHITIDESAKTQTVGTDGSAIYTFTLSESAESTDFNIPTVSTAESTVSLTAAIDSVSDKTLKVKVTATANDLSNLDVSFSITIAKKDNTWSQKISGMKLSGVSISKYTVTMNAGEHGYFETEGITTKTLSEKKNKISLSDLTTPSSTDEKYTFSGWYKTSACVDKFDFNTVLTEDTTLYAGWAEVPVVAPNIEYDDELFTVINDPTTKTVTVTPIAGQTITKETPVKIIGTWTGYQFNFIPSEDDTQVLEIDLDNFVLVGDTTRCPFNIQKANDGEITEMSFSSVHISCTKDTNNYIYDGRTYGASGTDELKGAINCKADLKIKSKGFLKINDSSSYKGFSQGIHCTKDLEIQKCTLNVSGYSTAVKGNKSITIQEDAQVTATSATGDAFKTEDIDVSSSGKRRGDITVIGDGTSVTINATKDAFQAAHNLYIGTNKDGAAATKPTISMNTGTFNKSWSESVVTDSQDFYFRSKYSSCSEFCKPENYKFGVYFTNESTATGGVEVEATLKKITAGSDPGARWENANAYWNCNRPFGYKYAFIKLYDSPTGSLKTISSKFEFSYPSGVMGRDLISLSSIGESSFGTVSWESKSYKEEVTGQTGERAGKTSYSSKGMKAANLLIAGGTITASVCDDFIHTKYGQLFPAGGTSATLPQEVGKGNVTITGGTITLNDCPDDGIHADGTLTIGTQGGTESDLSIQLTPDRQYTSNFCCYEGLEASIINIYSGTTKIFTKDDGMNASCCGDTIKSGVNINVTGGLVDITAEGGSRGDVDGIDSNNTYTQTGGTVISRGHEGTAFDLDGTGTITGGSLICIGKVETQPSYGTLLTKTENLSCSFTAGTTKTMNFQDGTSVQVYFKYQYNSANPGPTSMSTTVFSEHGTASWQ